MNKQNNQNDITKLDLVNPLNPNQIIKSELLIKDNTIEENEIDEHDDNQKKERKSKKKINLLLIIVILLIIIALVIYYFTFFQNNNTNKNNNNQNNDVIQKPTEPITLENIVNIFNQYIINYPLNEDSTISAELRENDIAVTINLDGQLLHYYFTYNDRILTATILKDDDLGFKITTYILSCIGQYNNIDFDQTVNYLNKNKDALNTIETLNIIEVNDLMIIRFDIDKTIDITK